MREEGNESVVGRKQWLQSEYTYECSLYESASRAPKSNLTPPILQVHWGVFFSPTYCLLLVINYTHFCTTNVKRRHIALICDKLQVLVVCRFRSQIFAKNHQEEVAPDSSVPRATQPWLLSAMELLH
jgi:hypothetical protein